MRYVLIKTQNDVSFLINYVMKTYLKCIIIFCLVCIAFSCNETEVLPDVQSEDAITVQKVLQKDEERNALYASAARNLASGLEDLNVRSFVRERVNEQFDGDYDFLVETSKYEQLPASPGSRTESLTFGDVLFQSEPSASGRTADDLLSMIGELHPLMQVALPELAAGDAESWDMEQEVPLVAFVPSDYDESNENATITAYDFEGNQYELSGREEPDRLVIVISDNESLIAFENPESDPNERSSEDYPSSYAACLLNLPPYYTNGRYSYYFKKDIYEYCDTSPSSPSNFPSSPGSRSGSRPSSTPACDRERNNSRDRLLKARFTSKSAIRNVEDWVFGRPEMYVLITTAQNPHGSPVFGSQRKWIGKENWYHRKGLFRKLVIDTKSINIPIFTWDDDVYGDRMVYTWMEEDKTVFKINFDVEVKSTFNALNTNVANVTISGHGSIDVFVGDDLSGHATVEYCNNTDGDGTRYVGGGVEFWVDQE